MFFEGETQNPYRNRKEPAGTEKPVPRSLVVRMITHGEEEI